MLSRVMRFLAEEDGLATVEWVILASGVIILAVRTASVVRSNANSAASTIGSKVIATANSNS